MDANLISYVVFVLAGAAGGVYHAGAAKSNPGESTLGNAMRVFFFLSVGNIATHLFVGNGWNLWPDVIRIVLSLIFYIVVLVAFFWNSD